MLRESREPYFDVLIEHGVAPATPPRDVAPHPPWSPGISPWWHDGSAVHSD
jgi:hypothetical protein